MATLAFPHGVPAGACLLGCMVVLRGSVAPVLPIGTMLRDRPRGRHKGVKGLYLSLFLTAGLPAGITL